MKDFHQCFVFLVSPALMYMYVPWQIGRGFVCRCTCKWQVESTGVCSRSLLYSVPAWSCFREFFPVTVILIRGSWQACWSSSWTETVWKAPAPGPGPGALSWTGGPQIRSSLSVSAHPIWTTRGNTLLSADCDVRSHRMHDPATVAGASINTANAKPSG